MNDLAESITVNDAIKAFYRSHHLGNDGGQANRIVWIKFWFVPVPIINLNSRNENVVFHDINHIITQNPATWKGECAVSAWEIASGGWGTIYSIWFLALWTMGLGVILYPKTTLSSFRKGLSMHNSLSSGLSREELLSMKLSDLNHILDGHQSRKDRYLWLPFSLLVFLSQIGIAVCLTYLCLTTLLHLIF